MQTRRDQLQAYRFQNRRALAALVTGQPNVLEPPMRRLTVTTLSGIMIAILIAIVFGVVALIRPSAGSSWQNEGAVIVDSDNNSTYVYSKGTLHPTLNYTSAVLAVSGSNTVSRVSVSSSDIADAKYGFEIGSTEFPSALPASSSLVGYPLSTCSLLKPRDTTGADAQVTLHLGSTGGTKAVPSSQAALISVADQPGREWLLYGGQRLQVGSTAIATALGLSATAPVPVGTAFLDSIPQGTALVPPPIRGQGGAASFSLGGVHPLIGTIVKTSDSSYLVLRDHTVPLTALELDLYPGVHTTQASQQQVEGTQLTSGNLATTQNPLAGFTHLPPDVPSVDPNLAQRGGVCAVFEKGSSTPSLVVPSGTLASYQQGPTGQSDTSRRDKADHVDVPATKALLARSAAAPGTVLIVSQQGVRYAFADLKLLSAFGYQTSDAVQVPSQLLTMIPKGPGLSRSAALQRVPR